MKSKDGCSICSCCLGSSFKILALLNLNEMFYKVCDTCYARLLEKSPEIKENTISGNDLIFNDLSKTFYYE